MQELKFFHRCLLCALVLLVALYVNWFLINPPLNKNPSVTVFVLNTLPTFLCLWLVFKANYRGFIWVCFISLLFFCIESANMFQPYKSLVYSALSLWTAAFLSAMGGAMQYGKKLNENSTAN